MFQVMTPGMLPKLKDLRSTGRCIFVIATNYIERIDPAAVRVGRVDLKYLVGLPSLKVRQNILLTNTVAEAKKYLGANPIKLRAGGTWTPALNDFVEIANATALANYGELCQIVRTATNDAYDESSNAIHKEDVLQAMKVEAAKPLTVRIAAFRSRLEATASGALPTREEPLEEFMHVLDLFLETDANYLRLSQSDKEVITSYICSWCKKQGENVKVADAKKNLSNAIQAVTAKLAVDHSDTLNRLASTVDRWFHEVAATQKLNSNGS